MVNRRRFTSLCSALGLAMMDLIGVRRLRAAAIEDLLSNVAPRSTGKHNASSVAGSAFQDSCQPVRGGDNGCGGSHGYYGGGGSGFQGGDFADIGADNNAGPCAPYNGPY